MNTSLSIIIQGCLKRDTRAEYALYRHCFEVLKGICFRYTKHEDEAKDLMNRTYLKVLQSLSSYNQEKPFEPWIKTIAINTIIDLFRVQQKELLINKNLDISDMKLATGEHAWNEAEVKLNVQDIKKLIDKLPELNRIILNLFVFEGYSHAEIGEMLGIYEGTCRWHLMQARENLKVLISKAQEVKINNNEQRI